MAEYTVSTGGRTYAVRVDDDGPLMRVRVEEEGADVRRQLDDTPIPVRLERWVGSTCFRLEMDGASGSAVIRRRGDEVVVTLGADQHRLRVGPSVPIARKAVARGSRAAREITAPMPGLVVSVQVAAGDAVEQGRAVAVMEAMKMQSEIRAPLSGTVTAVNVHPGQEVATGTVMVVMEPGDMEPGDRG